MHRKTLLVLIFAMLSCPAFAQSKPSPLVIGLIPELNVFKQMERFQPLAGYLGEELGREVRFSILSRYGNIIDSFSKDNLDGAFFGSFTGAMAIEKLSVAPLARPVNLDGLSSYHGYIYARKDSGIENVADMKGKKFAFVEKATTAGYIFPLAYLREKGITDIDAFFGEYFFAGSHDASLYAVLEGRADIGASKNTVYELMKSQDPRIERELTIIAESARVPSNGLCVRKNLDESIKRKLQEALLNLHQTPRGKEVLEKLHALRFIETSVADYRPVFELAANAGIDLKTYQYRNE